MISTKDIQLFKDIQMLIRMLNKYLAPHKSRPSAQTKEKAMYTHIRETLYTEGGKSLTKEIKCFAPCFANWSAA